MAKSKNVTIRLREDEYELFNRVAKEKGLNRTDMIRVAVKQLASNGNAEVSKPVLQRSQEVVSAAVSKSILIKDFKHPFLSKVESEGFEVHDKKGNKVRDLHDLHDILNFVENDVFIK